jgi:hypothetical protein
MKIKALKVFDDYKEKVTREIGDIFTVSQARYKEIKAKLPDFIEEVVEAEKDTKDKK